MKKGEKKKERKKNWFMSEWEEIDDASVVVFD